MNTATTFRSRAVERVVRGQAASDGDGVKLTRVLTQPLQRRLDPFLMLDAFGSDSASDYVGGFPDHPHRGFETVTYMLEGKMRHGDNKGRSGVIETGGVQWMRAGRGIVHSEMPEQVEGRMRGFQLWVNLPSHLKMSEPDYQEFDDARIPVETREGGLTVKVITGATGRGTAGPVKDASIQPLYFDVTAPAGSVFSEAVDPEASVMVVVFEGAVKLGERTVEALGAAFLGEGDEVRVEALRDARFLLLAGRPIREPIAWAGPFVMNTGAEQEQAFDDYRSGRF